MRRSLCLAMSLAVMAFGAWTASAAEPLGVGHTERILGMSVDPEGVAFRVRSNGCTTKEDFVTKTLSTSPRHIDLVRVRPDACEQGLPFGTTLRFSWEELSVDLGEWYEIGNDLMRFGHVPSILPPGDASQPPRPGFEPVPRLRLEPLLGIEVSGEGITYRVLDGGCVTKENFRVRVLETQPQVVLLLRASEGSCQLVRPYWVDLSYSWQEIGLRPGQRFEIGNDLQRIGIRLVY